MKDTDNFKKEFLELLSKTRSNANDKDLPTMEEITALVKETRREMYEEKLAKEAKQNSQKK